MSRWFQEFGYAQVTDGLLVGAYPTDEDDVVALKRAGVRRVYNLCEDVEYREGQRDAVVAALGRAGMEETRLPLVDYGGFALEQLEHAVEEVLTAIDGGHAVYLHCRAGWQRSATVAAGVIALREDVPAEAALERLARRKPTAVPLEHQRADLVRWLAERNA